MTKAESKTVDQQPADEGSGTTSHIIAHPLCFSTLEERSHIIGARRSARERKTVEHINISKAGKKPLEIAKVLG